MSALPQLASPELCSEQFDRIGRETEQILKKWDERLRFPLSKLGERYLRKHLHVHLHLGWSRDGIHDPTTTACAVFYGLNSLQDHPPSISHSLRNDIYQLPVFVELVKDVDDQERRVVAVNSLIRLQAVDSYKCRGTGDSLYFSTVTGMFHFAVQSTQNTLRGRLTDGELNFVSELAPGLCRRELPNDMVKRGAQMMDNFSGEHTESWHCGSGENPLSEFVKRISILVTEDNVVPVEIESDSGQRSQELRDLGVEISDILIGPF